MDTHASWLEIDAGALAHNIAAIKQCIYDTALAVVVKGNAYGHGLHEIISCTKDNAQVDWYCTGSLTEALTLRKLQVKQQILVLYNIDADPALAMQQEIDLIAYDRHQLERLVARAQHENLTVNVHIKIDTGLSRFGFMPSEAPCIIQKLKNNPHVNIQGIFTHLADAEIEDQEYTDAQLDRFAQLLDKLERQNMYIPWRHAYATSAACKRTPGLTNLARIGAGVYGLWPSQTIRAYTEQTHNISLKQVITWKTRIVSTRVIEPHTPIGYGRTFRTTRSTRIGILPIGYADGYHRRLSNTGTVYINGSYAPVIGRTAMNVITVDITDVPSAQVGSEVILLGPYARVQATDLAHTIGSFNPREVLSRLSPQVPRKIVLPKQKVCNQTHEIDVDLCR